MSCCHGTAGCLGQGEKHMCETPDPYMFSLPVVSAPDSLVRAVRDLTRAMPHGTLSHLTAARIVRRLDEEMASYATAQVIADQALDIAERALERASHECISPELLRAMLDVVNQARNVSPKFSGSTVVLKQKVDEFDRVLFNTKLKVPT